MEDDHLKHVPPKIKQPFPGAENLNLRTLGYLTEDETALALGVTKPTLRSWRAHKRGPPWSRVGRKIVYGKNCLSEFIAAQTVTPVSSGS